MPGLAAKALLANQGVLGACEDNAIKEIISEELAAAMEEQGITKVEMAARMKSSRRQLDRLLDRPIRPSRSTPCALAAPLRVELT
jgi:antitoxin HicB